MLKKLMLSTALSAAVATGAWAQSSSTDSSRPEPAAQTQPAIKDSSGKMNFVSSQKPDQWLASKFKGTDVLGSDNQKIGDVSDIMFDKDHKILAYVVSVGGFLGMGAKDVALEPSAFQVVAGDKSKKEYDKLKLDISKDEVKQAAAFEPYKAPASTTGMGSPGTPRPAGSRPAQ